MNRLLTLLAVLALALGLAACGGTSEADDDSGPLTAAEAADFDLQDAEMSDAEIEAVMAYGDIDVDEFCSPYEDIDPEDRDLFASVLAAEVDSPVADLSAREYVDRLWEYCEDR